MDPNTRKTLIKKRAIAKTRVTSIKKYVDSLDDDIDIYSIRIRREALQQAWDDYKVVQDELEIEDAETEAEGHAHDREACSEIYYELHAKMSKLIDNNVKVDTESQSSSHSPTNSRNSSGNLKLPPIKLPVFTNNVIEFRHFYDTFDSLVIKNEALDNIQRYYYLLSAVSGEAHKLIENLPVTSDNFAIAWKLIYDRYNNPRLVATTHIKALLSPPVATKECPQSLRTLLNHCKSNVNALEALDLNIPLHELIISQLYLEKVDPSTRKDWELRLSSQKTANLEEFIHFMEQRCHALELLKSSMPTTNCQQAEKSKPRITKDAKYTYVSTNTTCILCNNIHHLYKCRRFREASQPQRFDIVKRNRLCYNCLASGHTTADCPSEHKCRQCERRHHTLIHRNESGARPFPGQASSSQQHHHQDTTQPTTQENATGIYCSFEQKPHTEVLLATAMVNIYDKSGNLHKYRALLDSASQTNFITETVVQRVGLKKGRHHLPIQGINEVTLETKHCVNVQLHSCVSDFKTVVTCSVLPKITGDLPSMQLQHSDWNIPQDLQLADPTFHTPGKIDLLLGAEIFFELLRPERRTRAGHYPVLQSTELGWILSGKVQAARTDKTLAPLQHLQRSFFLRHESSLDLQLQRFWELENLPCRQQTTEEKRCEDHFKLTTTRDSTGRYTVRLPRRQEQGELGESYYHAKQRLLQLERRLQKHPDVRHAYNEFLSEYEQLGHMKEIHVDNITEPREVFYLPHHAIFKASSTTTKTRVVFDGSARSSNGSSLNDTLMVGPTIQQDLYSIVLRFRTRPVAFSADITKMYRQINVHSSDTPLQRILWRSSPEQPVKIYELKTVTYGTSCAPFLATRCLHQLAEDEKEQFPLAASILKRDFYVDDLITATNTIEEALHLQGTLISLLSKGGFPLRKFSATHKALINAIPMDCRETQHPISLDTGDNVKTLGLLWNPTADQFLIHNSSSVLATASSSSHVATKRSVASIVASTFDPLGLISPIIINCKIFLQELWLLKLSWDDQLPQDLQEKWSQLLDNLQYVNDIRIDRLVTSCDEPSNIQLHGFCDASEKAYGACLYLRSANRQGKITCKLLCSKSRVAPVRKVTLPRLELCGATLLAQLVQKTVPILGIDINSIHLFTDSTIVLAWITASPSRWKTFVANRVAQIQEETDINDWKHVPTHDNPADLISRGATPTALQGAQLWWQGPEWLKGKREFWKEVIPGELPDDVPEQRQITSLVSTSVTSDEITKRYSSYNKLIKVVAYCRRFIHNCHLTQERHSDSLSSLELLEASLSCIQIVQKISYPHEINALHRSQPLPKRSILLNLNPFIDDKGILRVGGRLENSDLTYDKKHQIILPPHHHFTKLLISHEHLRLLHAGTQLLVSSLREQYWIPRARQTIRAVLHKCMPCFKLKTSNIHQLMGQLPKTRVQVSRPFSSTGVDFAGPLNIKTGSARSKTLQKCYVAIFVCFSTRAVHIEIVTSLTSQAFIAALRRFVSRRGHVTDLHSDNGTTFTGASKELRELQDLFTDQQFINDLQTYAAASNLRWHFIPPRSPHFGGLWESAVKAMKHHLRRVMGQTILTYEELYTLLTQIEACMNSRPLCAISDDPNDPSILTPGHFLIGSPLMSLPDPNVTELNPNRLSRWQHLQQMHQHWWSRWSKDYLHTLQQRKKWTASHPNLQPGTLVLLKEDNQPPLQWKVGVVEQIFPGRDNIIRVATVRCNTSVFKRAITKLVPLPTS